jgi:hypothetical protein
MLSTKDLINVKKEKEKENRDEYKKVLKNVYEKIQKRNDNNFLNCLFFVPYAKPGSSLNNMNALTSYLIQELNKGGFVAYPYRGSLNTLYIDWSIDVNKDMNKKRIKKSKIE